jgi:hypothetical protein
MEAYNLEAEEETSRKDVDLIHLDRDQVEGWPL